jgi:hypothetical protein
MEALAAQTARSRLELVLSLDGNGRSPAEDMADLVVRGPHGGPAAARNRGWRAASGAIILFTDADCVPEPDWAEMMLAALEDGAAAAKGVYSRGGGALVQRLAQVEFEERYAMLSRGDSIDMVDTYSAGFRRNALERVDGFDEDFPVPDHEDVDLSYRLVEAGFRLVFAPRARVAHTHPDGWARYARLKLSRGRWRVRVLRRFPSRSAGDGYTPLMMRAQIVLAGLLPGALAAAVLAPAAAAAYLAAWVASSLPLARHAARTDPAVAPLVPALCAVRGSALAAGLVTGILREATCSRR